MVSIILPTYNGKEYICESIESIINQTYKDWELIIVDDCSNDGTETLVEKYASIDSRIKVIHNGVNLKLPGSLNVGFSHARGDLFSWTSDDNYYKKNAVEKMVDFLNHSPDTDIVYADYDLINEHGTVIGEVKHTSTDNIYQDNIVGACFLYKREVQDNLGGYDESLFLVEDYDFWLRAHEKYKLRSLSENLYCYRTHTNSLTGTKMKEITIITTKVLERILNNTKLNERDQTILLKRITSYIYNTSFDQNKFKYYMQMLRKISFSEYKACGIHMILCQYFPKLKK